MKIQQQLLHDILETSVEQGSSYWAKMRNYDPTLGTVEFKDKEQPHSKWRSVTTVTISKGINRIASGKININRTYIGDCHLMCVLPDKSDFDASLADCIVQAGLFNEIIYG